MGDISLLILIFSIHNEQSLYLTGIPFLRNKYSMPKGKNANASSGVRKSKKKSGKRAKLDASVNVNGVGGGRVSFDSRTVMAPQARGKITVAGTPSVVNLAGNDGRIRVRHREYVRDLVGSDIFECTGFALNPGLGSIFPWLSSMATNYESYKFKRLMFIYETQQSTSTVGSVMLAVSFDADDPLPEDKQGMMSYKGAVRGPTWTEFCYDCAGLDLVKFASQRYVRDTVLLDNEDQKTYDVGRLFLATQGIVDETLIGELYVAYDVELITPSGGNLHPNDSGDTYARRINTGTYTSGLYYESGTITGSGGLPLKYDGNSISFPVPGQYQIGWYITGASFSTLVAAAALPSGMTWIQSPVAGLATAGTSESMNGVLLVSDTEAELLITPGLTSGTSYTRYLDVSLQDFEPSSLALFKKKRAFDERRKMRFESAYQPGRGRNSVGVEKLYRLPRCIDTTSDQIPFKHESLKSDSCDEEYRLTVGRSPQEKIGSWLSKG